MTLSLYDITVPVFIRGFDNLGGVLRKARAFADERGIPHADLVEARLFPDMLTLAGQVQRASDTARFVPVRVGGVENVSMTDNEISFDELDARIAATVRFLKDVPADAMDGREEAEVLVRTRGNELRFTGSSYVLGFALPNFYFHVTTAYGILRHNGVPVGKMDYLGRS